MSQVKPLHPCVSWPPPRAICTKDVSSKLRHFVVSKVPVDYPYHVSTSGDKYRIPFYVIRGRGPPLGDPNFGSPGDVYLDLENTDSYALYLKTMTNWVQWHAAAISSTKRKVPTSNLFGHPHLEGSGKFLWCDGSAVSWSSRSTVKRKRRQMHELGLYHREDGMTDDIYTGAVVARIIGRMLECEEQRKTKRGMENFESADDEVEPPHKKARTTSQTPTSSDVDSSISSPQIHVNARATLPIMQLSPMLNFLPPPRPQGPSSYESMSGQGIVAHHFRTEEREITKMPREATQRVITENAELREEIPGRSFADIGTSSDDLENSSSEVSGQDMAFVTLSAPVIESFAASLIDTDALKALGVSLNKARLETQRIRLEMETKSLKADNLERRLSKALEQLEYQQHTTKTIQSLYDETNGKVEEMERRLLCVLNELGESNTTRLQTERKYSKLVQQMTRVKEALNIIEATDGN